jgi:hypothetical protein
MRYFIAIFVVVSVLIPGSLGTARAGQPKSTPIKIGAQPLTQLTLHSEGGDSIGVGQDYLYTPADGEFFIQASDVTGDGLVDNAFIFFDGFFVGNGFDFWQLSFNTYRLGINLTPGIYNRAQRAPFTPAGHPGLDVAGNGRGCNQSSGKFIVLDAQFDYTQSQPRVVSFAAQFEQHCEFGSRALFGTIYFNYTPTVTMSVDETTITGGQTVHGTVTLSSPASQSGATVELASSNSALLSVPPNVFIPPGTTTAGFIAETHIIKARPFVSIIASFQGVSSEATLSVLSPLPSLTRLKLHRDAIPPGGPFDQVFTEADGSFGAFIPFTDDEVPDIIRAVFDGLGFNVLTFSTAPLGIPLTPGFYPNVQPLFGTEPGRAAMDISGSSIPCNGSGGEFTILDIRLDDTFSPPLVISFGATFRLLCLPAPVTGEILINFTEGTPVGVFDVCLQGDGTSERMEINSQTGAYKLTLCESGAVVTGAGTVTVRGSVVTLVHNDSDRRVLARVDRDAKKGTATAQLLSQGRQVTITDRNTENNTCRCP